MNQVNEMAKDFAEQLTSKVTEQLIAGTTQTQAAICTLLGFAETNGEEPKKIAMEGICDITAGLYLTLTYIREKIGYQEGAKQ